MEIAGRGDELNEYRIGVDVLGRPADYSLVEDSSVRSRAYELRLRLEKFYTGEAPDAAIRIEIPKGGYLPIFVTQPPVEKKDPPPPDPPVAVPTTPQQPPWRLCAAIFAAGLAIGAGALYISGLRSGVRPPPILVEAWGPLAGPEANVLDCWTTFLHLLVRPYVPPNVFRLPASPDLYPYYRKNRPLEDGTELFLSPAQLSVPLAESVGIDAATGTLRALGSAYQILPEEEAPLSALRGRNTLVVGTPMGSDVITKLLRNTPLSIDYHPDAHFFAVLDQRAPGSPKVLYAAQIGGTGALNTLYGLITVLPSEGILDKPKRTVIFSGAGSPGTQGAMEFFSSAEKMKELKLRLQRSGLPGFPPSYQVVVRCKSSGFRLLSVEYEAHVVARR
jgi:hypothetical protein